MLVGLATVMARGQSWESSLDRLPRHVSSPAAAVQGIVRNSLGLGLGGVRVDLWNVSASQSVQSITTGDGVFRFLNLSAGHYQLTGGRPGFEPMQRTEIQLNAGEVFGFEETLRAVVPEPVARAAPAPSPAYRSLPDATLAGP